MAGPMHHAPPQERQPRPAPRRPRTHTTPSRTRKDTLSAYDYAKRSGARVIAVTSGGKLADLARGDGHTVILIPGGQPPRTALGLMFIPVLNACDRMGLLPAQDYAETFALLDKCA